jgi:S-sulfo-L-cysteine synthase (O-acetyl-L-serine-dependent)
MGTTGTIMGVGRYLKEMNPGIRIIGVEPEPGHAIQGLKNMEEAIIPGIYQAHLLDEKIRIGDEEPYIMARKIATREGIFTRMSSGAALAGVMKVAGAMGSGTIVTIFPGRGDRYLSTTLFRSICSDFNPQTPDIRVDPYPFIPLNATFHNVWRLHVLPSWGAASCSA